MEPNNPESEMQALEVLIPKPLADWLDSKVADMTFASQSHGIARALHITRSMPDHLRDTYPSA